MHGIGFDIPLSDWFDFKVPRTTLLPNLIRQTIDHHEYEAVSPGVKVVWLGAIPSVRYYTRKKKNQTYEMAELTFENKKQNMVIQLKQGEGRWLMEQIQNISVGNSVSTNYGDLEKSFEEEIGEYFMLFWNTPVIIQLRENGLLML
jgi:hypothetical protein